MVLVSLVVHDARGPLPLAAEALAVEGRLHVDRIEQALRRSCQEQTQRLLPRRRDLVQVIGDLGASGRLAGIPQVKQGGLQVEVIHDVAFQHKGDQLQIAALAQLLEAV